MRKFVYTVRDPVGIHARPAAALAKQAAGYESTISIRKGDETVSLSRIMAILGLNIRHGDEITLMVDGPDEEKAATEMETFLRGIL